MATKLVNGTRVTLTSGEETAFESARPGLKAADVKAEASRLILAIAPDWKQRNYIARATELVRKVQTDGSLTTDEQNEETAMKALWAKVNAMRAKSDELEALSPIPADYAAQLAAVANA
ncbi:hypothetical protein [Roseibium sp. MMSF_3412]|uniref:hypothetical protein n=1 Tax=Roseibium sp. MMSF_3412 TaxID=3046712 RepID=UPI00273E4197|nr:hypothetical protein [Roseibium sp. MMSF_3412]